MTTIIQFVTVMFMLSIICERVAEFVKNYLCGMSIRNLSLVGDTLTKYPLHSPQEQRRRYRILKINLMIGFITAFICHASLFSILQELENPGKVIGWPEKIIWPSKEQWFKYVSFPVGCFLTGAFISLGSKFWHDLLDILLEVKHTKRALTEQREAAAEGLVDPVFSSLPQAQQASLIEAAISANWEKWLNTIPNVTGVGIGNQITANKTLPQKVIRFEVSVKEDIPNLSEQVPASVIFGQYRIPTDVVEAGNFRTAYAHPGDDFNPRKCGASVSRGNNPATGTISLKVMRKENGVMKRFMLTSGHAVMDDELHQGITRIDIGDTVINPTVVCPGLDAQTGGLVLGNLVEGRITNHTDSALIELHDQELLDEHIYDIGDIGDKTRSVDERDVDKTRVKFSGAFSGLVTDVVIRGFGLRKRGDYPRAAGPVVIHQLIALDKCSREGDSGAVVLDDQNAVVGIIVGSNRTYTYVIPIQSVKSAHKQFIIQ